MERSSSFITAALIAVLVATVPLGCSTPDRADAKVELGRHIFFDASLSSDGHISCASCHRPELDFTDGLATSRGINGLVGTRNAPSLFDVSARKTFFWDGRVDRLPRAVLEPFTNPHEMGLKDEAELIRRFSASAANRKMYRAAFGKAEPEAEDLGESIAVFLDSLPDSDSRYVQYLSGNAAALTSGEIEGLRLFTGKAGCSACHTVATDVLTDDSFHRLGVSVQQAGLGRTLASLDTQPITAAEITADVRVSSLGRYTVTRELGDVAAFRTPSLRNVARTAPYMHDGSIDTLDAAVEHELYYRGMSTGRPIELTVGEQNALVAFLRTLSDS